MVRASRCVAVVVLVACADASTLAQAQKAGTSPAPKPPMTTTEEVIFMWNDIGRKVIAMAEDFPEAKYDFKPSPEVRTFAEQLLHVGGGNYLFLKSAKGEKWTDADGNPLRKDYPTKAAVVQYVKKSFADVTAFIKTQGDAGLARPMKHPFANRLMLQSVFWMDFVNHASEHYGQLVVYYRLNGIVPPESRQ